MRFAIACALALGVAASPGCDRLGDDRPGGDRRVDDRARSSAPPRPYDIVFIVVDTLRADHLGVYGYPRETSPHIDAFARRCVVFDRAYSTAPWTKPALVSLFSSLAPADHGVVKWDRTLQPDVPTLAKQLHDHGYRTEAYVSHDALNAEFNSFHLGFDVYDTSLIPAEKIELREFQGNRPTGGQERPSSRQLADVALRALQLERDEPLFMWIHFLDPHEPYLAHEEFPFGELPIDLYDSEVAFTDQQIGRLLEQLEDQGRLDRTIVVLTSDHGEEFQDHGGIGHAKTLYEELIRVPLIVHVPGFTPTRVPQAVSQLDVAPTVLALAGLPVPESFTGRVLPAAATGFEPRPSRPIFAHTQRKASKRSVLHDNWKLIVDRRAGSEQLFQIAEDPHELHDRSNSHPEVRDALKLTLENARTSGSARAQTIELSVEQKRRLEALGYILSEDGDLAE